MRFMLSLFLLTATAQAAETPWTLNTSAPSSMDPQFNTAAPENTWAINGSAPASIDPTFAAPTSAWTNHAWVATGDFIMAKEEGGPPPTAIPQRMLVGVGL